MKIWEYCNPKFLAGWGGDECCALMCLRHAMNKEKISPTAWKCQHWFQKNLYFPSISFFPIFFFLLYFSKFVPLFHFPQTWYYFLPLANLSSCLCGFCLLVYHTLGRMLKVPALIPWTYIFSVFYCNFWNYNENMGQICQNPKFLKLGLYKATLLTFFIRDILFSTFFLFLDTFKQIFEHFNAPLLGLFWKNEKWRTKE